MDHCFREEWLRYNHAGSIVIGVGGQSVYEDVAYSLLISRSCPLAIDVEPRGAF